MRRILASVQSYWRALAGRAKSLLASVQRNPDNMAYAFVGCVFMVGILGLIGIMLILVWFFSTARPWAR